jgi:membrane-associated phospholipid phosphatase
VASIAVPYTATAELRPVELVLLAYSALVAVVVGVRAPGLAGWQWLLVAHGLMFGLFGLLLLGRPGRLSVLREAAPLLLLFGLYAELDVLNAGNRVVHDALVQQWEAALFGGQPSRDWWRAAPSAFWSFVLHGAYLGYYLILTAPPVWLVLRRDIEGLRRFMLMVMTTFVVCYVFFIFAPVAGPYYVFDRPEGPFVDNIMARLVYNALEEGSSYGAAFPSSHVAATAAAVMATWRVSRRAGMVLVVPALLLVVSVVYCQMHYAVDAGAGLVIGAGIGTLVLRAER